MSCQVVAPVAAAYAALCIDTNMTHKLVFERRSEALRHDLRDGTTFHTALTP